MKLYEAITADNWRQCFLDDGARACLIGHAIRLGLWVRSAYGNDAIGSRLKDAIAILFPERGSEIVTFNNHPETTVEDVIRVCKLADV